MKKKALLVFDVSNIYYCLKKHFAGKKIDLQKFLEAARSSFGDIEIYRAIAYGSDMNNQAADFKQKLRDLDFEVKYKEPKIYPDPTRPGETTRKADWDVDMAMDVVRILQNVDAVIFATADGDLSACLEQVRHEGKLSFVFACNISPELRNIADGWREIEIGHLLETNVTSPAA